MASALINKKPSELTICRDASWATTPREVGDGMEALSHDTGKVNVVLSVEQRSKQNSNNHADASNSSVTNSPRTSPSLAGSPYSHHLVELEQQQETEKLFSTLHPSSRNFKPLHTFLNTSESCLLEEKAALKDHLQIQIQVNQELKRLLVASVGDDLGYHYERLATEKAEFVREVDDVKLRLSAKCEELERLEISCDIWRSKFLASRMQCDDLTTWRRLHERQSRELESAVRGLLREHWKRSENLEKLNWALSRLSESIECEGKRNSSSNTLSAAEFGSTDAKCLTMTNHLLENWTDTKQSCLDRKRADCMPNPTPAERYVMQILSEIQRSSAKSDSTISIATKRLKEHEMDRALNRLHSYSDCENLTLNCCNHCKGNIFVV